MEQLEHINTYFYLVKKLHKDHILSKSHRPSTVSALVATQFHLLMFLLLLLFTVPGSELEITKSGSQGTKYSWYLYNYIHSHIHVCQHIIPGTHALNACTKISTVRHSIMAIMRAT